MVNRNVLIGKVSPFTGKREIVVANQDTVDIIDALIKNHYKYSNEYDKIFRYFDGGSVEETAFNVWQFLKDDFKYTIEPEKMQILRSPAAILASNVIGIDCKGYATFANGIMDAYRRNTKKDFEVYYRFASYDPFDNTPQHVFAVVKENGEEFWIDPVLDQFDEKRQPYYYKDKKIKNMALVAMSGVPAISGSYSNNNANDQMGAFDFSGGSTDSGSSWWGDILKQTPDIIKAFNKTPTIIQNYDPNRISEKEYISPQGQNGISQNTVLLLGAAGLAVVLILTMRKR
jgi:hypothetical protein